ncbi:MAG: hypothetical protein ACLTXL_12570 [Clostridia bacterium]
MNGLATAGIAGADDRPFQMLAMPKGKRLWVSEKPLKAQVDAIVMS